MQDSVVQTQGDKQHALWQANRAWLLTQAVASQDLEEVAEHALALGFGSSAVTIGPDLGLGGERAPFPDVGAPAARGPSGCDESGCDFEQYRDRAFYANDIQGSVLSEATDEGRSITIDLLVNNTSWAVAGPSYITGQLEVTATSVSGAVSQISTYADYPNEFQSTRLEGISFDEGVEFGGATPSAGNVSAEWSAVNGGSAYRTLQTSVAFP